MLKHYLTVAWRGLFKQKVLSILKILGLAISIVASFMILHYVHYEFSYDSFHEFAKDIYKVELHHYDNGEYQDWGPTYQKSPFTLGPQMSEEIPEIIRSCRIYDLEFQAVFTPLDADDNIPLSKEKNILYVDSNFLAVFTYPLLEGNPETALSDPKNVILTETLAIKYFGTTQNLLGKIIHVEGSANNGDFVISGVMQDPPSNSHLSFSALFTIQDLLKQELFMDQDGWNFPFFDTYALLSSASSLAALEEKINLLLTNKNEEFQNEIGLEMRPSIQNIRDIHLSSIPGAKPQNSPRRALYYFVIIGVLILGIAWINYVNFSIAGIFQRVKEIGIRKVVGAHKKELIFQFLWEVLLTYIISLSLGILLIFTLFPYFSLVMGESFEWNSQSWIFLFLFSIGTTVGFILTGIYPASYLSYLNPSQSIKGILSVKSYKGNAVLKDGISILQFSISILLIVGTIIIVSQITHLQSQDSGMELNNVLVIESAVTNEWEWHSASYQYFKDQLRNNPSISQITSMGLMSIPGEEGHSVSDYHVPGKEFIANIPIKSIFVSENFLETYQIQLIAGKTWEKRKESTSKEIIVNEAFVKAYQLGTPKEAIHSYVMSGEDTVRIIGIVNNVVFTSAKEGIKPLVMNFSELIFGYYAVSIMAKKDIPSIIPYVEKAFMAAFPGSPFIYYFQDDLYNQQYLKERNLRNLLSFFSITAILLTCFGLLGLIIFQCQRKTKEVAIRKVLGASANSIFMLLSQKFLRQAIISALISLPIAYLLTEEWLAQFATRVEMSVWYFITPLLLVIVATLLTISYHVLKAAYSNPIEKLKIE